MTDRTEKWLCYAVKVNCNGLVLCSLDPWEAVCFREVHGYLYTVARQVSLYVVCSCCVYLVKYVSLYTYILCSTLLCTLSSLHYVCINNMHVAVCPLIVIYACTLLCRSFQW